MQDFRNIKAWQRNHELTIAIYKVTGNYPDTERYGLVCQMRGAVVSVGSNIAEGSSRATDLDFRRFLFMALGSLAELESQLIVSRDVSIMEPGTFKRLQGLVIEIRRMLWALIERLEGGPPQS